MNSAAAMAPQTRPKGTHWTVDESWKAGVRADMAKAGISSAELARRIGCSPSALTVLWRPETKESRLVPAIHRVLGRSQPQPVTAAVDDVLRKINRQWPQLTAEGRALVEQLVEQLSAKR
jgi:lambda repressor-like predicted transcriptional regulator